MLVRRLSLAVWLLLYLGCTVVSGQVGSPTTAPLKVAVVGLVHGHVEGFFNQNLRRTDIKIVAIVEPDQQLFQRYAKKFNLDANLAFSNLDQMLEHAHPDAVVVFTTTYDHRRVVETCARHHVHVMMEKPLAVSFEDAKAIQNVAHQTGIHVLVNYETTWYPSNHAAYDLVQEGAIGGIRKIVVHDGHRGPKEINVGPEFLAWLTDPKLNGAGALFDFGCYGADLSTWLMKGERPRSVTAVTQTIKPEIYPHVDDEATIVLSYPKAQTIIQASWNWPFDRKDMEVYGQTGYVMTVAKGELKVRRAGGEEQRTTANPLRSPYDDPLSELRAVVLEGAKPDELTALDTNVTVMEILDAARQSAASGRTVQLPR
jgi:predicted dehydrogenase